MAWTARVEAAEHVNFHKVVISAQAGNADVAKRQ